MTDAPPLFPEPGLDQDLDLLVVGPAALALDRTGPGAYAARLGGPGGAIARALADLGRRVGLAAPLGRDAVGDEVRHEIGAAGIAHLTPDPVPGRSPVMLTGSAYGLGEADSQLSDGDLRPHLLRAPLVVVTAAALAADPAREAAFLALDRAQRGVLVLDGLPWPDPADRAEILSYAVDLAPVVLGDAAGWGALGDDPPAMARRVAARSRFVGLLAGSEVTVWRDGAAPVAGMVGRSPDLAGTVARLLDEGLAGLDPLSTS